MAMFSKYNVIFSMPLAFKNGEFETRLSVGRSMVGFSFDYGGAAPGSGYLDLRIYKRGFPTENGVRIKAHELSEFFLNLKRGTPAKVESKDRLFTLEKLSYDVCGAQYSGFEWGIKVVEQRKTGEWIREMRLTPQDASQILDLEEKINESTK